MIEDLIRATAVTMKRPEAYGSFHIIFALAGIAIVVPMAIILSKRLTRKQGIRVLFAIGVIMLLSEVYKQLFYTYVLGAGVYQWYMFPLQLCSVPMYCCLALPLFENRKVGDYILTFLASYGLTGGVVSYISPESMFRDYLPMTLHSMIWHMVLIFIGIFAGLICLDELKIRDFVPVAGIYYGATVVGLIMNVLLYDKSYVTVGADGGKYLTYVNMMYVGPHRSILVVCRDICDNFGWVANYFAYTLATTACTFGFFVVFKAIVNSVNKSAVRKNVEI